MFGAVKFDLDRPPFYFYVFLLPVYAKFIRNTRNKIFEINKMHLAEVFRFALNLVVNFNKHNFTVFYLNKYQTVLIK